MEENAYLVLGCYGRIDNDIVLCASTENRILKLDDALDNFEGIIEYFENLKLFDRPIMDQNALRHLVYNLQNKYFQKMKPIWPNNRFKSIETYLHMHKMCGVYARLIIVPSEIEPIEETKIEEPSFFVQPTPKLTLIQGNK